VNFLEKRIKKSGKTTYQVAKEIGISERKLKDVLKGTRQLKGTRLDDFVKATTKTKQDTFTKLEMEEWYKNTDIKKLRIDFGYTLKEMSGELDMPLSSLNLIENRKQIPGKYLERLFDFFHDDLNKKTTKLEYKTGKKPKMLDSLEMDLDAKHRKHNKKVEETKVEDINELEPVSNKDELVFEEIEKAVEPVKEEVVEPVKETTIEPVEKEEEPKEIVIISEEDIKNDNEENVIEDEDVVIENTISDRLVDVQNALIDTIVDVNKDKELDVVVRTNLIYKQTTMLIAVLEEERKQRNN